MTMAMDLDRAERKPPPTLRPYQAECLQKLIEYRKTKTGALPHGGQRAVVVMATGAGKTVVFAQLPKYCSKRMLVLAHREELLDQAADKIRTACPGISVGIEQAERTASPYDKVVIASVPTFAANPPRLKKFKPEDFSIVLVDECHHVLASSYLKVLAHFGLAPDTSRLSSEVVDQHREKGTTEEIFSKFRPAPVAPFSIGFTATPERSDGRGLEYVYDDLVYSKTMLDLMEEGYLCPVRGVQVPTGVDISKVKVQGGDFQDKALAATVNTPERNELIVDAYLEHAADRQAVVFCVDRAHARDVWGRFYARDIASALVLGNTDDDERATALRQYQEGKVRVLVNVMVLTEGWDAPKTGSIIMARPTKSSLVLTQCLSEDTEVLTPQGFQRESNIKEGDLIAGFDPETGAVRYVPVLEKTLRAPAKDEHWICWKTRHSDIKVTEGHRMLSRIRKHGQPRQTSQWQFVEAGSLAQYGEYSLPVSGNMAFTGVPLTAAELRFIGWFIGEGSISTNKKKQIESSLVLRQASHSRFLSHLVAAIEESGFHYTVQKSVGALKKETTMLTFCIPRWGRRGDFSMRYPKATPKGWERIRPYLDKTLSPELDAMTATQFEHLLEGLYYADGIQTPWKRKSRDITTVSRRLVDRLQHLALLRGYKATISGPFEPTGISKQPIFIVRIKKTDHRHLLRSRARPQRVPIDPAEKVWCVSNELSTLITRRNGHVTVVGNCIGRGTRIYEGKKDLLVIDMVDVCAKAGVQTLNTLFGLPPRLSLTSDDVRQAKKKLEQMELQLPPDLLAESKSFEDVARAMKEFNPLVSPKVEPEIANASSLAWMRTGYGFVLTFPRSHGVEVGVSEAAKAGSLGVITDMLGHATLKLKTEGSPRPVELGTYATASDAVRAGDLWLRTYRGDRAGMLDRNSRWRNDPPTDAQIRMLRRLKIPHTDGMTKGDASVKISQALERKGGEA